MQAAGCSEGSAFKLRFEAGLGLGCCPGSCSCPRRDGLTPAAAAAAAAAAARMHCARVPGLLQEGELEVGSLQVEHAQE
jgi:hypothetical protein